MKVNVLLVENDFWRSAELVAVLQAEGYQVSGHVHDPATAMVSAHEGPPDLLVVQDELSHDMDGMELSQRLKSLFPELVLPTIYTSNSPTGISLTSSDGLPLSFLRGPFTAQGLFTATSTAFAIAELGENPKARPDQPYRLRGSFFIRDINSFEFHKEPLHDIVFVRAERQYSKIFTYQRTYLVPQALEAVFHKLNHSDFLRVHRNYFLNISHVESYSGGAIRLRGTHDFELPADMQRLNGCIPIGASFGADLVALFASL